MWGLVVTVVDLTHSRQPFALFDDLFDRSIVPAGDNGDSGPTRIERRSHRNRFDVEAARAEQSDDPLRARPVDQPPRLKGCGSYLERVSSFEFRVSG
jgi:hypothetical protein